ncbi:MAG: T9SS type A sorting domain-containing protein [Bacteroidales bacterium]|nr:T9SS type A sorting domain-containing protein [Bacteroidales bacterium]
MRTIKKILIVATFFILTTISNGQNWQWEWAHTITKKGYFAWLNFQDSDLLNNLYSTCPYDTILFLPDTTFYHPEQTPETNSNVAIIIHNSRGEYISAIDMYAAPDYKIFNPKINTDYSGNSYASCTFSSKVYIQDTIINHNNYSNIFLPDGLIVKFNNQNKIVWATLIQNTLGQYIHDLIVYPNGEIYCLSEQVGSLSTPTTTIFFEQDTVFSDHDFTSVTKLDNNKNIIWRKDLHGEISSYNLIQGNDSLFYLIGNTISDIILDQDTLFHPNPIPTTSIPFLLVLDKFGNVQFFDFQEFLVYPQYLEVNSNGEKYISGTIVDTLIILQDTIIPPEDSYYRFVGKFNSFFQPLWYYYLPRINNQSQGYMSLELAQDNLIFMITCYDDFQIADTTISIPNGQEAFIGEFSSNGELLYITNTVTSSEFNPTCLTLDNCKNPIISGSFQGVSYLGSDTIHSYSNNTHDGFIAKLIRNETTNIDLGSDTSVCEQFTMIFPADYQYYIANDSILFLNYFLVNETGMYILGCADENGCWAFDTINIQIHPGLEINLGIDTTIRENDTIVFSIPDQYESYLWFNGSTSNKITIIGNEYGIGTFPVWIEVSDGPCVETDTILLTIKSEFGIAEFLNSAINIYPNPFTDYFTIEIKPEFQALEIIDLDGTIKLSKEIKKPNIKTLKIVAENLTKGIYLLKIKTSKQNLIKKIIKIK